MWILATVLGVLASIVLLLSVPVDLVFTVERDEHTKSTVRVGWLFDRIGVDLRRKAKREKAKPAEKKKKRWMKAFLALLQSKGFLRRLLRFVADILRISHLRYLDLNLRIGLDDPADTGIFFGALFPIVAQAETLGPLNIQVLPDFLRTGFRGYLKGDVRIFPIQLISIGMFFVLSPVTIRAAKNMVSAWSK